MKQCSRARFRGKPRTGPSTAASAALRVEPSCPSGVGPYAPHQSLPRAREVEIPTQIMGKTATLHPLAQNPFRIHRDAPWSIGRTHWQSPSARLPPRALRPMSTCCLETPARPGNMAAESHLRKANAGLASPCSSFAQQCSTTISTGDLEGLPQWCGRSVVPRAQSCCCRSRCIPAICGVAVLRPANSRWASNHGVDAILTNAAGCGSAMHEFNLVLRCTPDEPRADAFRKRVLDVASSSRASPARALCGAQSEGGYHDSCHSLTRKRASEPRPSFAPSPGLELIERRRSSCCSSAGT